MDDFELSGPTEEMIALLAKLQTDQGLALEVQGPHTVGCEYLCLRQKRIRRAEGFYILPAP
eukprot:9168113-Alexandrium_andersonii.AAC.1